MSYMIENTPERLLFGLRVMLCKWLIKELGDSRLPSKDLLKVNGIQMHLLF